LTAEDFDVIRVWLTGKTVTRKKSSRRSYQQRAIGAILPALMQQNRATAVMARGPVKTFVAPWVAEAIAKRTVLELVFSLALSRQTLREWVRNTSWQPFDYRDRADQRRGSATRCARVSRPRRSTDRRSSVFANKSSTMRRPIGRGHVRGRETRAQRWGRETRAQRCITRAQRRLGATIEPSPHPRHRIAWKEREENEGRRLGNQVEPEQIPDEVARFERDDGTLITNLIRQSDRVWSA
jgi:hypothetical protein